MTVYINDKGLLSISGLTAKQFCQIDSAVALQSDMLDDGPLNATCEFGGIERDPDAPFQYIVKMKVTNGDIRSLASEFEHVWQNHLELNKTITAFAATTTPT